MHPVAWLRSGTPALALALLLTACTAEPGSRPDGTAGEEATACAPVAGVPAGAAGRRLDLGDLVVWEVVAGDEGSVNAAGIAEESEVAPVLAQVRERMADQGWEVFSLDDEGFEAEVLARGTDDVLLGVTLRRGGCPTRVEVTLSVTDYAALD